MKKYTSIRSNELTKDIKSIRTAVFIEEQEFSPSIVFDELDEIALHVVLYEDDVPIATGRIIQESKETFRFGRIAVLLERRKGGFGARIMEIMEERSKPLGAEKIVLSAQSHGRGFYEKCGYHVVGEEYAIHGCPHVNMEKELT